MKIKIGKFDFTECWDGVLYKNLSEYPDITDWEIQTVLDFIDYEEGYGRPCVIEADEPVKKAIADFQYRQSTSRVPVPARLTECTACPTYHGCMTDFVCHTSPLENAVKILKCGSLLSPVLARKMPASKLQAEKRNAANDPADYFDYIMFAWGNCQAGDRLVTERRLGHFPSEEELGAGFTPGVRFFFRYEELQKHPNVVFEGVLPLKVKDEVVLRDWVCAIVAPTAYRKEMDGYIPDDLRGRVHYLDSDGNDIWKWSERVYELVKDLERGGGAGGGTCRIP